MIQRAFFVAVQTLLTQRRDTALLVIVNIAIQISSVFISISLPLVRIWLLCNNALITATDML